MHDKIDKKATKSNLLCYFISVNLIIRQLDQKYVISNHKKKQENMFQLKIAYTFLILGAIFSLHMVERIIKNKRISISCLTKNVY